MKTIKIILFFVVLASLNLFSQKRSYADSLLNFSNISILKKMVIIPISLWQNISYSDQSFNCQFFPSCSNYSALAIARFGLIPGFAITADRLIRCNPFAHGYHIRLNQPFFHIDGRILNHVPKKLLIKSQGRKSAIFASGLSSILPGAGRIYAGRTWDGLFGFLTVLSLTNLTYSYHLKNNDAGRLFFGSLTMTFYLGELFGAYQTTLSYNKL
ncbi:MAG: hypothetical protein CMG75_08935 [Candidatus Marinimicrobia bacterium]|nr:hypothetical protein [Candidatus Neomarinimicrobiota bacterium]|tara:strand:+ start:206 stop:844 length:639 start_codon:yes stop_codon:yes gene_type:complete